jgi:hypothetical protein
MKIWIFSLKLDIELILAIYSQPRKRKKKRVGWGVWDRHDATGRREIFYKK